MPTYSLTFAEGKSERDVLFGAENFDAAAQQVQQAAAGRGIVPLSLRSVRGRVGLRDVPRMVLVIPVFLGLQAPSILATSMKNNLDSLQGFLSTGILACIMAATMVASQFAAAAKLREERPSLEAALDQPRPSWMAGPWMMFAIMLVVCGGFSVWFAVDLLPVFRSGTVETLKALHQWGLLVAMFLFILTTYSHIGAQRRHG